MDIACLSLFSGTGMLDIGWQCACEQHGLQARTVGYCEREAYAAGILLARMEAEALEPAPIWCGDLRDLSLDSLRRIWSCHPSRDAGCTPGGAIHAITAGFPCQPFSLAGSRQGTRDSRWMWDAIAGLILEIQPAFVALENVPGFFAGDGRAPGRVMSDLSCLGFDAEWLCLTASAVGASHKRNRWFCLAYRPGERRGETGSDSGGRGVGNSGGERLQVAEPQVVPGTRRGMQGRTATESGPPLADPESDQRGRGAGEVFAPGPAADWRAIIGHTPWLAPSVEPGVCMLADGMAAAVDQSRADQLRATGNGVVPLQAAVAFAELLHRVEASR